MCGILGSVNYVLSENSFRDRLDLIAYRGPDGSGMWTSQDQSVRLGHRRLSIIDTSDQGKQPMQAFERYHITYNGEIFNYIEIREELRKQGVAINTQSDTEVLLKLMVTQGMESAVRLNGMWAFAIYDSVEKKLLVSRDRMGEKPLFYVQQDDRFVFASEMKCLYGFLETLEYDADYMNAFIADPHSSDLLLRTHIKGIRRFPAGHHAVFQDGKLTFSQYFFPEKLLEQPFTHKSIESALEEFEEIFTSSCMLRLRSDVRVGSSLSGGIDSGLVLSTISQIKNFDKKGYAAIVASFPGSAVDETAEALSVAAKADVQALQARINPDISSQSLLQSVYDFEELSGTSSLPFYQTYKMFRDNGILVTLDGHGGDELFGGYAADLTEKLKDDFPSLIKTRETLQIQRALLGNKQKVNWGLSWLYVKQEYERRRKSGMGVFDSPHCFAKKLHQSSFSGILPKLLRNYDKYSMRNGVEVRMPFLDYRLVEFAFRLPNHFKIRDGFTKYILRLSAKGKLPEHIRTNRLKIGWNSPMGEWFGGVWREWLLDEVHSASFTGCQLIDAGTLAAHVNTLMSRPSISQDEGQRLWLMLQPYLIEKANGIFHQAIN